MPEVANLKIPELMSPTAPTVTNAAGGRQSRLDYRFDRVDPVAMFILAGILHEGSIKYNDPDGSNWRLIEPRDHLNHALAHIYGYLDNDSSDDHLGHAFCRLMMAVAVDRGGGTSA